MGIESPKSPLKAKSPEEHLEAMLREFPEENLERLEARIADRPVDEQVAIVEEALKKRREIISGPRYVSPSLRMIERVPDSVFEKFADSQEFQIEVGRGENGRVFEYESSEDSEQSVVFKMLIRHPLAYQNDLLEEGAYQADMAAFAERNADLGIGVPHPYYVASSHRGYVLAMEKLPGMSIEKILRENIPVPASLDLGVLESKLKEFVQRMNDAGFYHRDIREGNIMLDLDRGEHSPDAYLIDFGFCIKAGNAEEAYAGPRGVDGLRDDVMISKVIEKIRMRQERSAGISS